MRKRKSDQDFYKMFQLLEPSPDRNKKQEAVRLAVSSWTSETECPHLTVMQGLARTFRTISPVTWAIQALLVMMLIMFSVEGTGQTQWRIMLLPSLGLLGICEVCRSFYQEMWELEQSCRFSLMQIMVRKLLVFGGMDLSVLAALTVAELGGSGIISTAWTLLIPFFMTNAFYLLLLNNVQLSRNFYAMCAMMLAATAGLGVAVSNYEGWPWLVEGMMKPAGTAAVSLLSMAFMIYHAVKLCRSCRKEDMQWNCV